jgi:putative hemolysin
MSAPLGELGLVEVLPVFAALFGLSFFFSGTETALFSLQTVDRQRFEDGGPTGRRILRMLEHRAALISSILIGNETVNVSISALGAFLLATLLPGKPWVNVVVLTPMLLLLSEITPKVIAFRYNARWSRAVVWPLSLFVLLVTPVRWLVAGVVILLARPLGVRGAREDRLAEPEIRTLLQQGAASGDVAEREREIIEAVFEFDDLSLGRLMTPLPDVFAVPVDMPWNDLLRACRDAGLSRVPVYDTHLDNVVGVLLLKDLLKYRNRPPAGPRQLRSILLPPTFVPRSKSADVMLREFMERRYHMAFVVNEHGTMVGLVTLDDLLSELVGEILDGEDDVTGPEVERPRPGMLRVKAIIDLEDFDEETGIHLPEGEYETVGGFVFHLLGRVPQEGDCVEWEGHRFEVVAVDGRRITELRVHRPTQDGDDDEEVAS